MKDVVDVARIAAHCKKRISLSQLKSLVEYRESVEGEGPGPDYFLGNREDMVRRLKNMGRTYQTSAEKTYELVAEFISVIRDESRGSELYWDSNKRDWVL